MVQDPPEKIIFIKHILMQGGGPARLGPSLPPGKAGWGPSRGSRSVTEGPTRL